MKGINGDGKAALYGMDDWTESMRHMLAHFSKGMND